MWWLIISDSVNMNLSKLWDIVKERAAWHAAAPWACKEFGHDLVTEQQQEHCANNQ